MQKHEQMTMHVASAGIMARMAWKCLGQAYSSPMRCDEQARNKTELQSQTASGGAWTPHALWRILCKILWGLSGLKHLVKPS
jgi:hypothetical protein